MILAQLIINGIIAGAIYALMASSFSLIFNIVKFMDLSLGALFVTGAFSAYTFNVVLGFPFFLAMLFALIFTVVIGMLINQFVYKYLRNKNATNFVFLLTSFGVFLFITGAILLFYGAEVKSFNNEISKGYEILGFIITRTQIELIAVSIILFIVLQIFMNYSKTGRAMRAMADDKSIASTLGINPEKMIVITSVIAALFAGIAGILVALEQNLEHTMGFNAILKGLTASIIGGVGNVPASILGGFLIGIVENIGIWYLPSGYKDAIAFALLIIFLLLRPHGLLGVKTREDKSG
jgi:branched-chain amino acid transport system permease protein